MRDSEFVEVVHMRKAKDDWSEEYNRGVRSLRKQKEGNRCGAEEDFFRNRALKNVSMLSRKEGMMCQPRQDFDSQSIRLSPLNLAA